MFLANLKFDKGCVCMFDDRFKKCLKIPKE